MHCYITKHYLLFVYFLLCLKYLKKREKLSMIFTKYVFNLKLFIANYNYIALLLYNGGEGRKANYPSSLQQINNMYFTYCNKNNKYSS